MKILKKLPPRVEGPKVGDNVTCLRFNLFSPDKEAVQRFKLRIKEISASAIRLESRDETVTVPGATIPLNYLGKARILISGSLSPMHGEIYVHKKYFLNEIRKEVVKVAARELENMQMKVASFKKQLRTAEKKWAKGEE